MVNFVHRRILICLIILRGNCCAVHIIVLNIIIKVLNIVSKVYYTYVCVCYITYVRVKLFPTVCTPLDYSPLGSAVHEIFQARILEWVAISLFRGSSKPRDQTRVSNASCIGRQILYHCAC